MNEKRIDDFLRTYEPIAPDATPDEEARIVSAATMKPKRSWVQWSVAALAALTIVGVAAYWLPSDRSPTLVASVNGDEILDEMFASVFEETEDVGYDYITLAQAVSN